MVNQLYIVVSFFLAGLVIGVVFDIFRVTRKSFNTPNMIIYIEDILFWILTGFIIIITILSCTDGQIRLYMILMLFVGAFAYFTLISKYFIKINVKIINIIQSIIQFIIRPFKKILILIKKNKKLKNISKK